MFPLLFRQRVLLDSQPVREEGVWVIHGPWLDRDKEALDQGQMRVSD